MLVTSTGHVGCRGRCVVNSIPRSWLWRMGLYPDTCSIQRPLDDRAQLRIRFEAEAISSALDLVEAGQPELIASDVLDFEISRNPHPTRREFGEEALAGAQHTVELTSDIVRRAVELNRAGIASLA